jgi:hypothetical protein
LFRSADPYYETIVDLLDDRGERLLTRRESQTEPPNYFVRDLVRRIAPRQVTQFADPAPAFAEVRRESCATRARTACSCRPPSTYRLATTRIAMVPCPSCSGRIRVSSALRTRPRR